LRIRLKFARILHRIRHERRTRERSSLHHQTPLFDSVVLMLLTI